jgi:gas vesicle protein
LEAHVTEENSRAVTAAVVGAIVGGVAGYLFFTERGRTLRRQMEPALEDISRELNSFRNTVQKAAGVANEGWKLLNDALAESGSQRPPRYAGTHQSSPF